MHVHKRLGQSFHCAPGRISDQITTLRRRLKRAGKKRPRQASMDNFLFSNNKGIGIVKSLDRMEAQNP